jgi:Pentapeptide repeats (8 copies)
MLILEMIVALLAGIAGALLVQWLQNRRQEKAGAQQESWERTQTNRLQAWESQQEKRATERETRLTAQLQRIQEAWKQQETKEETRLAALAQDYQAAAAQLKLEHEISRVMRVEETPLTTNSNGQQQPSFSNWRPLMLPGANLSKRDLSHRYLAYADLREASLTQASLFMANLSGACLVKANLTGADLSGVDLSGADLSDAILTDANLLVADLNKAILTGANLLGARGITPQQIRSATYDNTTVFDPDFDPTSTPHALTSGQKSAVAQSTESRLEAVRPDKPLPTPAPQPAETPAPARPPETPVPPAASMVTTATPATPTTPATLATLATEPAMPASIPTPSYQFEASPQIPDFLAVLTPTKPKTYNPPLRPKATKLQAEVSKDAFPATSMTDTPAPAASVETNDTSAILEPEILSPSFIPDMTSFIQHLEEPAPSPPLASSDSLLDPGAANLLVDEQESKRTVGPDTTTPNRKNNGKRKAKGD